MDADVPIATANPGNCSCDKQSNSEGGDSGEDSDNARLCDWLLVFKHLILNQDISNNNTCTSSNTLAYDDGSRKAALRSSMLNTLPITFNIL